MILSWKKTKRRTRFGVFSELIARYSGTAGAAPTALDLFKPEMQLLNDIPEMQILNGILEMEWVQ